MRTLVPMCLYSTPVLHFWFSVN